MSHLPDALELDVEGRWLAVRLRTHPRARALRLTLPASGGAVLTVPHGAALADAEKFLLAQKSWLARHLPAQIGPRPFAPGASVPLRGAVHRIALSGSMRGGVTINAAPEGPQLLVAGAPDHLPRRLTDWFKRQAHSDLEARVAHHAERLDVRPSGITMRSQSTRWGSCSSRGRLNFNWRLVLAPPFVLDYVAAHEVAHLLEMNHSPRFWATVARTLPEMERGRRWLRHNGGELLTYGRD